MAALNKGESANVSIDDERWFNYTGVLGMNDKECGTVRSWDSNLRWMILT